MKIALDCPNYMDCDREVATLRAKLAETERERDEAVKMLSDSLVRESRTASVAEERALLYRKLNGDLISGREAMRADRDALAAKLSEARSLCYRASRSDMLPAEILGELAGIVGEVDDDG